MSAPDPGLFPVPRSRAAKGVRHTIKTRHPRDERMSAICSCGWQAHCVGDPVSNGKRVDAAVRDHLGIQ